MGFYTIWESLASQTDLYDRNRDLKRAAFLLWDSILLTWYTFRNSRWHPWQIRLCKEGKFGPYFTDFSKPKCCFLNNLKEINLDGILNFPVLFPLTGCLNFRNLLNLCLPLVKHLLLEGKYWQA